MKKKCKNNNIKNILIVILILMVTGITIMYSLKFNYNTKMGELIKASVSMQSITSGYLGEIKSETFDLYTIEQLLLGSTDINNIEETKILNNENEELLQLVSNDEYINYENMKYYKLKSNNFEKKFNITLYKDDSLVWYIGTTGDIKVNYISKPIWWNQGLDVIYIGE